MLHIGKVQYVFLLLFFKEPVTVVQSKTDQSAYIFSHPRHGKVSPVFALEHKLLGNQADHILVCSPAFLDTVLKAQNRLLKSLCGKPLKGNSQHTLTQSLISIER